MSFSARWGAACGRPFDAKVFLAKHPQFEWMTDMVDSRPSQPWATFVIHDQEKPLAAGVQTRKVKSAFSSLADPQPPLADPWPLSPSTTAMLGQRGSTCSPSSFGSSCW